MSLTPAHPNELNWRGIAALGQFHTCVLSCVYESVLLQHVPAWLSVPRVQHLPFRFAVATVASTVQRQSLDNKRRWQPIWCQLRRAVTRPSLWAQTLTSTLVLLPHFVISLAALLSSQLCIWCSIMSKNVDDTGTSGSQFWRSNCVYVFH